METQGTWVSGLGTWYSVQLTGSRRPWQAAVTDSPALVPSQRRGAVLEKQLPPLVEDGRIQAQLFTRTGRRRLLDQTPPRDGDLLLCGAVLWRFLAEDPLPC